MKSTIDGIYYGNIDGTVKMPKIKADNKELATYEKLQVLLSDNAQLLDDFIELLSVCYSFESKEIFTKVMIGFNVNPKK